MSRVLPFLRWAGGKRWIAWRMAPLIQEVLDGQFIEPFLGSAAMFFALAPKEALLSDLNADLVNVYRQVARHDSKIELDLKSLEVNKSAYYRMRSSIPKLHYDQALRFIYLNRTCYGGLHRTNKKGEFNVPYGGGSRTPEPVYRDHLLKAAGRLLRRKGVKLSEGDFESVIDQAAKGDVVFCDPTYRSAGRGRFDRYGPVIFSWLDQNRLLRASLRARDRGAVVIVMNADDHELAALYKDAFTVHVAKTKAIGNATKSAGEHQELIAILDPQGRQAHWAALSPHTAVAMRGAA